MSRETIIGVLHVIRTRKRVRGQGLSALLGEHVLDKLEDMGRLTAKDYYPLTYFILNSRLGVRDYPYQFRFKGRPKVFSYDLKGHEVTVKATVEGWGNHSGGYLLRPEVIDVGGYVECPYHEDAYPLDGERIERGSSRIYCFQSPEGGP